MVLLDAQMNGAILIGVSKMVIELFYPSSFLSLHTLTGCSSIEMFFKAIVNTFSSYIHMNNVPTITD